jgi:hypothetical protein
MVNVPPPPDSGDDEDGINMPPPDDRKAILVLGKGNKGQSVKQSQLETPSMKCKHNNTTTRRNKKRKKKKLAAEYEAKCAQVECGAFPVHRKDVRSTGVEIPVSWKHTCMPDALATIVSSIMVQGGCEFIQLPDGTKATSKDLERPFRESLTPNGEWVSMESMESFLSSIGFNASCVGGPDRRSKVAVLTREQGNFLVVSKLQKDGKTFHHAVAYLADNGWMIDNSPYDKVMELDDSDIAALTFVDENLSQAENHQAHKSAANKLFKERFAGAINEILVWYEITRA